MKYKVLQKFYMNTKDGVKEAKVGDTVELDNVRANKVKGYIEALEPKAKEVKEVKEVK